MLKDGVPWALHMGEKVARLGIPVVYSVNSGQRIAYSAIFSEDQMIVDATGLAGPLNGLFTAHRRYPDRDIVLLACDMLDMDIATLEAIVGAYAADKAETPFEEKTEVPFEEKGYEFYAYEEGAWLQPFGAIYTAAGLGRVGAPADGRLQSLLRAGRTMRLIATGGPAFNNYNTLPK